MNFAFFLAAIIYCISKSNACFNNSLDSPKPQPENAELVKPPEPIVCGRPAPQYKPRIAHRIIYGTEASPHSWPWQLLVKRGDAQCGGSVVEVEKGLSMSDIMITAAHCVAYEDKKTKQLTKYSPETLVVYAGYHNRNKLFGKQHQKTKGATVEYYPGYNWNTHEHDIAVVQLKKPINFTAKARPICRPVKNQPMPQKCYVTGWGYSLFRLPNKPLRLAPAQYLQQLKVDVQPFEKCEIDWGTRFDDETSICASGSDPTADACKGDSGGPLQCQEVDGSWTLYGITSAGEDCTTRRIERKGGRYTRASNYDQWIDEKIIQMSQLIVRS